MTAGRLQILPRFPDRVKARRSRRPTIRRAKPRWPGSLRNQRVVTETRASRCNNCNRSKESSKSKRNVPNVPNASFNSSRRDSE